MALLTNPIDFWDQRHAQSDLWRSGGDRGLSEQTNQLFYNLRLGILIQIFERYNYQPGPSTLLDAGCGKGFFSNILANSGHIVYGIDSSQSAINFCKENCAGTYQQSTLNAFTSSLTFDAVYTIDVLFHILDDYIWESSIENLMSLVSTSGLLILADVMTQSRIIKGNYIVHRQFDLYQKVIKKNSFEFLDFFPYNFRHNKVGFLVFKRQF